MSDFFFMSNRLTSHIFDGVGQDVDQFLITEGPILLAFEVGEITLGRVFVHALLILAETHEKLGDRDLVRGLAHEVLVDRFDILLVASTGRRMPAVGQVELNGALVTHTLRGGASLLHLSTRVLRRLLALVPKCE